MIAAQMIPGFAQPPTYMSRTDLVGSHHISMHAVLSITATALARSARVFFARATYLCLCSSKVTMSAPFARVFLLALYNYACVLASEIYLNV